MTEGNPLSKFFRQPQFYIKLPSNGRWYAQNSIDLPVTKELPVYSMTAKDELALQTPDALLNGQATVDVIQSCLPNIKNAWEMPAVDIDPALIAIRRATYGNSMPFVTVCPHCKKKNENNINLEAVANRFKTIEFDDVLVIGDLEFYLKPQSFYQINKSNLEKFEHQRFVEVIGDKSLSSEDKQQKYIEIFNKLLDLTVEQVSLSVVAIRTQDQKLIDSRGFIDEYMRNCNKETWNKIKDKIVSINDFNPLKELDLQCDQDDCQKEYKAPLIFEHSSFFG